MKNSPFSFTICLLSFFVLIEGIWCLDYGASLDDSWAMPDGNMWRSRYVRDDATSTVYQTAHLGWRILPRSVVMDPLSKQLYGMANNIDTGRDFLIAIDRVNGTLLPIVQFPSSEEGELVKEISPLYQQEGNYYFTVRRNPKTNMDFILRTSVLNGTHFSFTTSRSYSTIYGMILVKSGRNGIAVVNNNLLVCYNSDTGVQLWEHYRDFNGHVKLFLFEDYIHVFCKDFGYQFSAATGSLWYSVNDTFHVEGRQEYFALTYYDNTLVATIQKGPKSYMIVNYSARRVMDTGGKSSSIALIDQFGVPIDLNDCSNIVSTPQTFSFMCKARNSPPFVYSYSIKGIHISKSYEINLSYVTGNNAKNCSNHISLVDDEKFAVVCDTGMVIFKTGDSSVSPRVEFKIPINAGTQVFATDRRLTVISTEDTKSFSQSLKTK